MRSVHAFALATLVASLSTPSFAQQYECLNNAARQPGQLLPPPPDAVSSATWQRLQQISDPSAMQSLAGTWQGEIPSPQTNQLQRVVRSFEANGLFQYQDQTCGTYTNMCSNNFGNGLFLATRQADGSIFFMVNFSDMNRTNQCFSDQVVLQNASTMVSRTGTIWTRVQ